MSRLQNESIRLSGLYVYPIKSCGGISLESAELDATGLRHDRRWMLVDETGEFVSQRTAPRMALVSVSIGGESLTVRAPGMTDLEVPFDGEDGDTIGVEVWGDRQRGVPVGGEADRWFGRFLGGGYRLVRQAEDDVRPVDSVYATDADRASFADRFPFLLISEASLEDLNGRMESPLPMNRFRPNLVVRGCGPYSEDGWAEARIGGTVFRVAEPCRRCAITMTDQNTAERAKEPLRTLATYRRYSGGGVIFGRNLIHALPGTVRVGDAIEVTPR